MGPLVKQAVTVAIMAAGLAVIGPRYAPHLLAGLAPEGARDGAREASRAAPVAAPSPSVARDAPPAPLAVAGVERLTSASGGHFAADLRINGAVVAAMVDTGASMVALSAEDAARAGVRARPGGPKGRASTANGTVAYDAVRLPEVRLGSIVVRDVEAAIMPPGALKGTLLGMAFLSRLQSYEVRGGSLVLRQ